MWYLIYISFGVNFITLGDAIRCLKCQNIPSPSSCTHVAICNSDEYCFTEQVVTTSGNVVYNTGCASNLRCHDDNLALVGRRSFNTSRLSRRNSDIISCTECCAENFCNVKGCGTTAISPTLRGPYCYNCDALLDPKACESAAVCLIDQVCMLYSPDEFRGLPNTIYRSKCATSSSCGSSSSSIDMNQCAPYCCSSDFCNDQCLQPSITTTVTMTTPTTNPTTTQNTAQYETPTSPSSSVSILASSTESANTLTTTTTATTISTTAKTTSKATTATKSTSNPTTTLSPQQKCTSHKGYIYLHNKHTQLCVRIEYHHTKSWGDSGNVCKHEKADLVVLDTLEKSQLLRNELCDNDEYHHRGNYWIGTRHVANHDYFSWTNGHRMTGSETDWAHGEPDHDHASCVGLVEHREHSHCYQWYDASCSKENNYICEINI